MINSNTRRLIDGLQNKKPIRILFVCLGNICRSPAAQGVMQSMIDEKGLKGRFELDSCGFYRGHAGDLPDRRMRVHAVRRGYNLDHISRPIRPSDFDNFDLILAMDDSNYYDLMEAAPSVEAQSKVAKMIDFAINDRCQDCVPDPYYSGAEGFELVLDLLEDACSNLLSILTNGK